LDLGVYRGIGEITRHDIHDVHKRLEEISKTLGRWTHTEGLKVVSRADRKDYREELEAHYRELEEGANDGETEA
jgi:hypothetical protein